MAKSKGVGAALMVWFAYGVSAHAANVTVAPAITATSTPTVCTVTGTFTIMGEDTDGRTQTLDRYRTRITRNGTTGGAVNAGNGNATVTKGATEEQSASYGITATDAGSATSLFFNVTERDDHTGGASNADVISSTQISAAVLSSAGGQCSEIANLLAPSNAAPVANAGADQMIDAAVGTTITLDGSASMDADGDPITYAWTQTSGTAVTLSDATAESPTFSAPNADAALVFSLVVNDGTVDSDADATTVTYTVGGATNTAPVANAGPNQDITAAAGTIITLDGSGSTDADGDPLTYSWVQTGTATVTLTGADTVSPTFEAPAADETLFFDLIVNDGTVDSAADRIRVRFTLDAANTAPVADAGADQNITAVAGTTITLDGSGSMDADSDALTYMWTQTSGTAVTLSDATVESPTFSAPDADSTLVFSLVVNDGTVASPADTTTVNFALPSANTTPVANAGPNQDITAPAGTIITLDGSGSTDADGDPLTYTWVQTGTATVTLTGADTVSPSFAAPAADETLFFDLIVNDGTVDSAADRMRVRFTVDGTNTAPIADAGADQNITAATGTTITLNGSGSMDANGDMLTYMWTQTSGTAVTLNDATAVSPTFSAPNADATLVFSLVVNDGTVDSAADTMTVAYTVGTVANTAPVANAGPNQDITAAAGTTITLDGSGSMDANGDTLTYSWVQTGTATVTLTGADTVSPSFNAPSADETLFFDLVVNDGTVDSVADRMRVRFTLEVTNTAPVANAGVDQNVTAEAGTTIILDASGSTDADGDTLTYSWTQTSGAAVTLNDAGAVSPTFSAPNADATLTFSLVVNDGTVDSAADTTIVTFTFVAPNAAPVADAGADQSVTALAGTLVTLNGSGSTDADGDTLTYAWTQTSGAAVTLSDATAASPTFSAPNADSTLVFSLVVNDGTTDSAADTTTVTYMFVAPNAAPVANAGADQDINAAIGSTVTLDASGSADVDGDTLTYNWTQTSGPTVSLSGSTTATPSFTVPDVDGITDLVFQVTVNDGEFEVRDSVTVKIEPLGSITIAVATAGQDGSFRFTSALSELNAVIQTTSGAGQLVADGVSAGAYTVQLGDVSQDGFAITSVSCSTSNGTGNTSARRASISLAPGEDITCTFSAVNSRAAAQKEIRTMLATRSTLLLANQPQLGRRLDRIRGGSSDAGGLTAGGFTVPGSEKLPVKIMIADNSTSLKASLSSVLNKSGERPKYDIWVEGTASKFNLQQTEGTFNVIYAGADMLVGEKTLVGLMAQYDIFDSERQNGSFLAEGEGFMVGPYATTRVGNGIYLDGRLAWGESDNQVSPLGTYRDSFDTDRYLARGSVTGEHKFGNGVSIRPTLAVSHIWEEQEGYIDSLNIDIPDEVIGLTNISLAPRLAKDFRVNKDLIVSTFMTAEGIYATGNAQDILGTDNLRGRLEGGLSFISSNGMSTNISAFSDGIGADGFSNEGVRLSIGYTPR